MTTAPSTAVTRREPGLPGQTVVIIGGSAGIGLETARRARAEGAEVILAARRADRLQQAAAEVGAGRTAAFDAHQWLAIEVARLSAGRVRPGGTLLFMGGTTGRGRGPGLSFVAAATAAMPALIANLAVEIAPVRVNLIAPGFVDTPLSASLLGDDLEVRRARLRATLPIGRVVGPADVAALAVHLMTNTAITGATYDIDGGQQLIRGA